MINITVDACELLRNYKYHSWDNILVTFSYVLLGDIFPAILSGCPYEVHQNEHLRIKSYDKIYFQGWYESLKSDINATVYPYLPPALPTGQYKIAIVVFETKVLDKMANVDVEINLKTNADFRLLDFDLFG